MKPTKVNGGRPPIKQKTSHVSQNPYAQQQRANRQRIVQSLHTRRTADPVGSNVSSFANFLIIPTKEQVNTHNMDKTFDVTFHTGKSIGKSQELPGDVGKKIYSYLHVKGGKTHSIKANRNRNRRVTYRLRRRT